MKDMTVSSSSLEEIDALLQAHLYSLVYPLDSWLEDLLIGSDIYRLYYNRIPVGYASLAGDSINYFHVLKEYHRYAPELFALVVKDKGIKRAMAITQDSLLSVVLAGWNYELEKLACWFTDGGVVEAADEAKYDRHFRPAVPGEAERIRAVAGDFFDEPGGGFYSLEERLKANTIFVIDQQQDILGCGVVEVGRLCTRHASIGMFTNPEHRHRGVATAVLLNLKKWVYREGLKPVAGCWYYNTLSRKSLEAAGMINTSIGYGLMLKGREILPLKTAFPPGEPG